MNILALDTASDTLHLALESNGLLAQEAVGSAKKFSETVVSRVVKLCAEHHIALKELDLVVCSKGPGSFTGLRIGMAIAKGIALGAGIPWVAVDTLEAYAHPLCIATLPVMSVLDARKDRYYCALFLEGQRICPDLDANRADIGNLLALHGRVIATGPDAKAFGSWVASDPKFAHLGGIITMDPLNQRCYGESLVALGKREFALRGTEAADCGPTYIRKSEAEVSLEERNAQSMQTR